ncbi:MAG: N-acetylmuramoyl-L-alanine amidase [Verrucomicrobiia bacterium]
MMMTPKLASVRLQGQGMSRIFGPVFGQAVFVAAVLFITSPWLMAQRLTPLVTEVDWASLEIYQETMSREDFLRLLSTRFAPRGSSATVIKVGEESATILTRLDPPKEWVLRFSQGKGKMPPRYWRTAAELGPSPQGKPLYGLHIALDPGHLGGKWARMEERWFQIGEDSPVTEGDMVLVVARMLAEELKRRGARVSFTRTSTSPTTSLRSDRLYKEAKASLRDRGITPLVEKYEGWEDPRRGRSVQAEAERLFYRVAEIRARAELVNRKLKPDLVLCIHFNAEVWGDPRNPTLVEKSHLHLLVNGAYSRNELTYDDVRRDMLVRILNRSSDEEVAVSKKVAQAMAAITGLPPYEYTGDNAVRLSEYVWARNLLANRIFECPVVFLEPYVMNSKQDYARIQAGDYAGQREIGGRLVRSIYREYVDGVVAGLEKYYETARSGARDE